MKRLLVRVRDWIVWRWNLPATNKQMADLYFWVAARCVELEQRCTAAEGELDAALFSQLREEVTGPRPGLTAAQIERLAWLAEECGEAVQAVGKVLRHGYQVGSPFGGPINRVSLEKELAHVQAAIDCMKDAHDLRRGDMSMWRKKKLVDVQQWMHHQS